MNFLVETQALSLGFEIWFLLLMVAGATAYFVRVVTGISTMTLLLLLSVGAFVGNVAARAAQLIPVTNSVTPDIVLNSTYACFAGMLAVMTVWFLCKLIGPALVPQRVVRRPNEPKPVTGT